MPPQIAIAPLRVEDADELSHVLLNEKPEYLRFFRPFSFDAASLRKRVGGIKRDQFWSIRYDGLLAGFFMLRGFDEGFTRPAFGVYVTKSFANRGLAKAALEHALAWCRENEIQEVMLKVAPENVAAQKVYERFGFEKTNVSPASGEDVMVKHLG